MTEFVTATAPSLPAPYQAPTPSAGSESNLLVAAWLSLFPRWAEATTTVNDAQLAVDLHPWTREASRAAGALPMEQASAVRTLLETLTREALTRALEIQRPLRLARLDDGSVLLEWTLPDRRLGFSFEPDKGDSGWYFVFSNGSSERYEAGSMDQLDLPRMLAMMTQT